MKKYIKPAIEVVNVENESVLAGSVKGTNESMGYGTTGGFGRGGRGGYDDEEWD